MTALKQSEVMRSAADLLRNGWVQGALSVTQHGKSSYCLAGALRMARHDDMHASDSVDDGIVIWSTISELYPQWGQVVSPDVALGTLLRSWNDAHNRTQDEVVTVVEKTAIGLEERGS